MYQPNGSLFAGLSRVILTLVILGAVTGLVLSGSDIVNFITNSAKAEGIRNENQLQAEKNAIDLENYQAIQDAAAQAQINKMKAENEANQRMLDQAIQIQAQKAVQDMEAARQMRYLKMGAYGFLALALGSGLIILALRIRFNRSTEASSPLKRISRFDNPAFVIARGNELQNLKERTQETGFSRGIPVEWKNLGQKEYVEIQNKKA